MKYKYEFVGVENVKAFQRSEATKERPIYKRSIVPSSKYMPHQGKKECERRIKSV